MHLVVGNVAVLAEIYGINDLVIPIRLVAIQVLCLTTVACVY